MGQKIMPLFERARKGEAVAFAQLLTVIEQLGSKALDEDILLNPPQMAFRLGITGPPGSGKSTLIGEMLKIWKEKGLRIGVLAIDPSSPLSKGAILGDRIRYASSDISVGLGSDLGKQTSDIFIRSLGTRGSLGGLSASAYLMLRAFDACGFDLVIIETVGVGQVEVEIMNVADWVALVLVPESGDYIQAMKAGVMEIADTYIVNKSDRPGADSLKREIEAHIHLDIDNPKTREPKKVHLISALRSDGVQVLGDEFIELTKKIDFRKNRSDAKKLQAEGFALLRARIEEQTVAELGEIENSADLQRVLRMRNRTRH